MPSEMSLTNGRSARSNRVHSQQSRSTASLFAHREYEPEDTIKSEVPGNLSDSKRDTKTSSQHVDNSLDYRFPLNYLFMIQDILNESMTFSKFIQIICNVYLLQVLYSKQEAFGLRDEISLFAFNFFGCTIAVLVVYKSQLTKHNNDPEKFDVPSLPSFNHIYSVLLPLYLLVTHKSRLFTVILSLNYFVLDNLNIYFNFLSSLCFFALNNKADETNTTVMDFFIVSSIYFAARLCLTYVNNGNRSLDKDFNETQNNDSKIQLKKITDANTLENAEIHLFSVAAACLFADLPPITDMNLPVHILQKLTLSLIVGLFAVYSIHRLYNIKWGSLFYIPTILLSFTGIVYFAANYQLRPLLKDDPTHWIFQYIFHNNYRMFCVKVWLACLSLAIPFLFYEAHLFNLNWRRKIWHFVLFAIASEPLHVDPQFLAISLLGTTFIFIVMEVIRYNNFTYVGRFLRNQIAQFQDLKDSKGPLNLSYIYLIMGTSIPIVFGYCATGEITIKEYTGLIALGIGDAIASIVGQKFGKTKWPSGTKSIEGTFAFVLSSITAVALIDHYFLSNSIKSWEPIMVATLLSGIIEGASTLNDNLLIPVFFFSSVEIIEQGFN